jgi:hypothetical protein
MITTDASAGQPEPRRGRLNPTVVIAGASAAPVLWLAQMLLSYGLSADVCSGLEWATALMTRTALRNTLYACDAIATCGALGGGLISYRSWHYAGDAAAGLPRDAAAPGQGGTLFLAQWGMLSSLWFLGAIAFNTIASIMITP